MTIVEFLHPIKGKTQSDVCLAALYYAQRYEGQMALTVERLRALLRRGGIPRVSKLNLADILTKSAPHVQTTGREGHKLLWALTPTGEHYVRSLVGLPEADVEIEHNVSSLETLIMSIANPEVASYVREAVICLSVNALRASVVFLWAAAAREIQNRVMDCNLTDRNASVSKYDAKARPIKKIDDLAYIKESALLLVAQDLGLFDKSQRETLEVGLSLRNKCGHPAKYSPGPKKVSSFIEDIVGILFT